MINRLLAERVPESVVVGEELSPTAATGADIVWFVDPLDGTTNFLHGYPQYAVSIGCMVRGKLAVGVIHDVTRDQVYRAGVGLGAWLGDRQLSVSRVSNPKHSLVGTGFPFKRLDVLERYMPQFVAVLRSSSGIRRAGSAALDLADVAAGRLDGFWELSLAPWDVAAGVVLIREAGGTITTLEGDADVLEGQSIVGGNPAMYKWLMELLNKA